MTILLKGCVLFHEAKPQIIEVHSVEQFSDLESADSNGAEYLNNGGDSYAIIDDEANFEWHHGSYEVYKQKLSQLN